MMKLAVRFGFLAVNPFSELTFKDFVPKYKPKHRAYIPASKLSDLFAELNAKNAPDWVRYYMLFCVYTLLRPKEASRVKYCYIKDNVLTMPANEMKEEREHRIPLCPEILKLLELVKLEQAKKVQTYNARAYKDMPIKKQSHFIWAFGHGLKPVNKQYIAKWIRNSNLSGKCCAHGFRRTGRDWLKDAGISFEVCEDALSHVVGATYTRAYIPTDYLQSRIPVMQKWWNYIYKNYCAVCAPIEGLN